jgi:hypothetical protein
MATRGGSGVALSAKAFRSVTATSTPLVRTIMMSSRMQSNLWAVQGTTCCNITPQLEPPPPPHYDNRHELRACRGPEHDKAQHRHDGTRTAANRLVTSLYRLLRAAPPPPPLPLRRCHGYVLQPRCPRACTRLPVGPPVSVGAKRGTQLEAAQRCDEYCTWECNKHFAECSPAHRCIGGIKHTSSPSVSTTDFTSRRCSMRAHSRRLDTSSSTIKHRIPLTSGRGGALGGAVMGGSRALPTGGATTMGDVGWNVAASGGLGDPTDASCSKTAHDIHAAVSAT